MLLVLQVEEDRATSLELMLLVKADRAIVLVIDREPNASDQALAAKI
jgi:hypothetical protein